MQNSKLKTPDIATYVETKLQGISSALAQADAILASTDFENDRQLDEEKRLDDNKDDFQISKNLAHALDLDPLIAIPPSPAVSNENDDVKRELKERPCQQWVPLVERRTSSSNNNDSIGDDDER